MSSLSTSTRIGHSLAKALGIKLQYRHETGVDKISRGESVFSVSSADTYTEDEPTTAEWFAEYVPTRRGTLRYTLSLFPFTSWILHYNTTWLWGDLVAGETASSPASIPSSSTQLLIRSRHYDWCCRRSARHGLRQACRVTCSVWSLCGFYGYTHILDFRDFEGYHYWRQ